MQTANYSFIVKSLIPGIFGILIGFQEIGGSTPELNWEKGFGGKNKDYVRDMVRTENGYLITGSTENPEEEFKFDQGVAVWKLDHNGNLMWRQTYGGDLDDAVSSIKRTKDNNYVLAGSTRSSEGDISDNPHAPSFTIWIMKMNDNGDLIWEETYGGTGRDYGNSVIPHSENGFIVVGRSRSDDGDVKEKPGIWNGWILHLNDQGKMKWDTVMGGILRESFRSADTTHDGGFVVGGWTGSNHPHGDQGWLLKFDQNKNLEWERIFSEGTKGYSVSVTKDGDYIMTGEHRGDISNPNPPAFWAVKLDESGEKLWEKAYGGSQREAANDVTVTEDNEYVLTGYSKSQDGDISNPASKENVFYWALKIDEKGIPLWDISLGGSKTDVPEAITSDGGKGYTLAGDTRSHNGDVHNNPGDSGKTSGWVANLKYPTANNLGDSPIKKEGSSEVNIRPNPFRNNFHLVPSGQFLFQDYSFNLFDARGRTQEVAHQPIPLEGRKGHFLQIEAKNLPPGLYKYRLVLNGEVHTGKVVKE